MSATKGKELLLSGLFILFVQFIFSQSHPVLSNFEVRDGSSTRVYFESSEPISGSSVAGFEISGKKVTGVTINSNGRGGFFTVSNGFTYFQKGRMIKYKGGSNIKSGSNNLDPFTWHHITNSMKQPRAQRDRYVTVSGAGKHDGSKGNEWTFAEALAKAKPGDVVHVKAGNYGSNRYTFKRSGDVNNPIVFQGYKNSPNDIKKLYWDYGDGKFDSREMPYFKGKSRKEGDWLIATGSSNVIFRNFQVENYRYMVFTSKGDNVILENLLADKLGDPEDYGGVGLHSNGQDNTYEGCIIMNATAVNMRVGSESKYTLLLDSKSYCDESSETGSVASTDYYISNKGSYNVIKNCLIERFGNLQHHGHGYTFKDIGGEVRDGLLVNSTVINIKQAIDFNLKTYNNVIRNVQVLGGNYAGALDGGVKFSDSSNNITFENCYFAGFRDAAIAYEKAKGGDHSNNRFINCVFSDLNTLIQSASVAKNLSFEHCTISNIKNIGDQLNNTNSFKNTIFFNVTNGASKASYSYNNFYKSFKMPAGRGNISVDPKFDNLKNFIPKNEDLNAGDPIKGIRNDKNEKGRSSDAPTIGAVEIGGKKSPQVRADAGEDVESCKGEKVTLKATGGGSYEWSTGEKTQSIVVTPNKTTTYTVTVKKNGSEDSDEVTVEVKDVEADAGKDVTINSGESVKLTAKGGGTYSWDTGAKTPSITVSPNKTTVYTVTVKKNGCTVTDEVKVTVKNNVPIIVADAGEDQEVCSGEEVTLRASGGNKFLWSTGATTKTIKVRPTETTTYSVKVSEGKNSDNDSVTVNVVDVTADAGNDVTIKAGESVTLQATGSGKYNWSNGETSKSITVSPTSTQIYTLTVRRNGCEATDQVKVTVTSAGKPVVANAGKDRQICAGEEITLRATGGKNYVWSTGEKTDAIKVSPDQTTTYTVTVSDGNKSDTDEVEVEVVEVTADAGKDVTIKEGETVTLSASGGGKFSWSTGETTQSIDVSPTKTQVYSVTVRRFGCEDTAEVKVTVLSAEPPVVADAGKDREICAGEEITLRATGGKNYVWSTGEKTDAIKVSPDKTTTYTVTVSDGNKSDTDEVEVEVVEVVADAGKDVTITEGETVTLSASGGGKFIWSTGETTQSINVSPTTTQVYSVAVRRKGCEDTAVVKVTVEPKPAPVVADAGKDQRICFGESITLTVKGGKNVKWSNGMTSRTITVNPAKTTTYSVTVSDEYSSDTDQVRVEVSSINADAGPDKTITKGESATLTASGGDSYLWNTGETTKSITVSPTKTTEYTVTVSQDGCQDQDKVKVRVRASESSVVANAGNNQTICVGEEVTLTAEGADQITWSTGETSKSIKVSPNETTTYSVTVTDGKTSDTDQVTVKVNKVVANAGEDKTINEGEKILLTASGGTSYLWSTGEKTKSIEVAPTSTQKYSVTVSNGGCESSDEVKVTVIPKPEDLVIDLGKDKIICAGDKVTLVANVDGSFEWSTGEKARSIEVAPSTTTTYTLKVKDGNRTGEGSVTISVAEINASAGKDQSIMKGESATLTATGGDSYLWSNGATTQSITVSPAKTSKFNVQVFKGACFENASVQVHVVQDPPPVAVAADAGEDQSICLGESVVLTAKGGASYLWSTGETSKSISVQPNEDTVYTVEVSDGIHSDTDDVTVFVSQVQAEAGTNQTINEGEQITLTASGGESYLWSTGETTQSITVSPVESSIYSVEVSNGSCKDTDRVQVIVVPLENNEPPVANAGKDITICVGESVKLTGKGGASYLWSTGDTGQTVTVAPKRTTVYTLEVRRAGQVDYDSVTVTVENCKTVGPAPETDIVSVDLLAYPVPSRGWVTINVNGVQKDMNLAIFDINGRLVFSSELRANYDRISKELDLSTLPKGVYIVRVYNERSSETTKIILA